jgi:beta-phosphoglucomutase
VITAVVFDFDGVLADSEPLHLRAYQDTLAGAGILLTREEYYTSLLGFDDVGVFSAVYAARGLAAKPGELESLVEGKGRAFESMIASGGLLYPGARECVSSLAAEYPLGIASGALRHEITAILGASGLSGQFRFIVASGDTAGKPDPAPYRRAAALHGIAPGSCVAIEDSRWGLRAARDAGLYTIGITHTYPRDGLMLADTVVDTLMEISPAFLCRAPWGA